MIWLNLLFFNIFDTSSGDIEYCDIKGNVKNPGVYIIDKGDVINDIVIKAGGLKKNSYTKNINLSKKVTDEMVIYIFSIDEYDSYTTACPEVVCNCPSLECNKEKHENNSNNRLFTNPITEELITTTETTITTTNFLLVNINTATLEELIKLPGVGAVIANNILDYRQENIFLEKEDILLVKGVGEKLFDKIKDNIKV